MQEKICLPVSLKGIGLEAVTAGELTFSALVLFSSLLISMAAFNQVASTMFMQQSDVYAMPSHMCGCL